MDELSRAHYDMESIVSNIVTILENCKSIGDSLGLPMDAVSIVFDETLDGISFFKAVKAVASIPDQLFFNKVERFLVGLDSVDDEHRRSFFAKNEKKLIENFETTLNLINKVEDRRKVDYLSKLFSAFIEESIGYNEYLRLAGLVANTPSTDLQSLCSLDLRGDIHLNDVEKESLAQNGWLIYAGQEVLEFDSLSENDLQKSDDQLYKASKSAVSFVNLMRSKTDKGPI